jgi:ABC-2 type transport system ATP-binding protein
MSEAAVQLNCVTKHFGRTVALSDVTLRLEPGEILGFLGPNGAGKSTALRIVLGLLRPNSGSASVLGFPAGSPQARASVSYVPGDVSLWPKLTGAETLELLARLHGSDDVKYRAQLIGAFEVDPAKRVRAYSKGNRQKIALIAAFASRAPVLVLDEPTSGLDPLMERVFRESVSEAQRLGQSVLLSSHLLNEVDRLCERVAMIREGRLVSVSDVEELRRHTRVIYDVVGEIGDVRGLEGVASVEKTEHGTRITLDGAPGALLAQLAQDNVSALRTREASLEEIFLSFYDGPNEVPAE